MTKENEDLIVEVAEDQLSLLPDDTAEIVAADKKPEAKPEIVAEPAKPDDAVEAMKAQIARLERERDEERRQRLEAQQEAQRRTKDAEDASGRAVQHERGMVDGYIAAAKSKQDSLKQKIRSAVEAGDIDAAEDLRMEAARVASRLVQYEDAKLEVEARAEKAKEAKPEPRKPNVDPVDALEGISEPSKNWLRNHRECITDPAKNAKLLYGHHEALGKGIRPDSEEYFEYLDTHMGYRQASRDEPTGQERRAMPAAPVSRDTGRTGLIAPGKYRLSREEADMAETLGMTPTEYATWKLKAEKDGRYQSQH